MGFPIRKIFGGDVKLNHTLGSSSIISTARPAHFKYLFGWVHGFQVLTGGSIYYLIYFRFGSVSFGFGSVQIGKLETRKYPKKLGSHLVPVWIRVVRIVRIIPVKYRLFTIKYQIIRMI